MSEYSDDTQSRLPGGFRNSLGDDVNADLFGFQERVHDRLGSEQRFIEINN